MINYFIILCILTTKGLANMIRLMQTLSLCFSIVFLTGCTTVKVQQVDSAYNISRICIEENRRVIFSEFLDTIKDRIAYHGIDTVVYSGDITSETCEYTLWYTALRSWDFTPYLSHAELKLYKNKILIGEAQYHLKGGGGLALNKWASVAQKMDPVIDALLNKQNRE